MSAHQPRKLFRLRSGKAFSELFAAGSPIKSGTLKGFCRISHSSTPTLSVGFAITRNVTLATRRNRVKRVLREAWRDLAPSVSAACARTGVEAKLVILYTGNGERSESDMGDQTRLIAKKVISLIEKQA